MWFTAKKIRQIRFKIPYKYACILYDQYLHLAIQVTVNHLITYPEKASSYSIL